MGSYASRPSQDPPNATPHTRQHSEATATTHRSEPPALLPSPSSDSRTQILSNLRRRHSSTNSATLPAPRRRRILQRLWGSSNTGNQQSAIDVIAADNDSASPGTLSHELNHIPNSSSHVDIEGTSGSGNIARTQTPNNDFHVSSRFIDELDSIASDLFNAVSREGPGPGPRMAQRTRHWSSRGAGNNSNTSMTHPYWHGDGRLHNSQPENQLDSDTTSLDDGGSQDPISADNHIQVLSRLLELAATSTVGTLMGTTHVVGRRFDNTSARSMGNNERPQAASDESDSTFQEFIHSLRNGLLSNELSRDSQNTEVSDDRTFFRAFRFDNEENRSNQSVAAASNANFLQQFSSQDSATNDSNRPHAHQPPRTDGNQMVPVMIVGVRSVQRGLESSDAFVNNYDNEVNLTTDALHDSSLRSPSPEVGRSDTSTSSTDSTTSESSNQDRLHRGDTEPTLSPINSPNQASWIIFVMGNVFNWNHPLLSAPSLMSENPTYEDLLNLQELIGQVKPQVVSKDELLKHDDQLFELKLIDEHHTEAAFTKVSKHDVFTLGNNTERCQICLTNYENNEIIRKLSSCNHFYHKDCIDTWLLKGMNNCPLCRTKGVSSDEMRNEEMNAEAH